MRALSLIQAIQENAELEQLQVEDWEDEASEYEATKQEELARVQQEMERLRQEQEAITRRQATTQHAEARREHISREGKTCRAPVHRRDPSPTGTEARASVRTTIPPTATTFTIDANLTPLASPTTHL
jgi:ATPase subunit of ABC transporter with duplicated ATPase domains